jgi:hypothetical protein
MRRPLLDDRQLQAAQIVGSRLRMTGDGGGETLAGPEHLKR